MGKSRASFSVENLGKGASDAAPNAPPVCPVWWVSWSALTILAQSVLSASGEERPVLPEVCLEAPDARRASGDHRSVLAQISDLFMF